MLNTEYAMPIITADRLPTYEFFIYDHSIRLITDIGALIEYIKSHYINNPAVKTKKTITITLLRNAQIYKYMRQEMLARGGKTQSKDYFESVFNLKNRSWLGLIFEAQQTIGYYALFQNIFKTFLKIDGFAFLHASCWTWREHCVIATGPSGYGKTTLLISAAVNGLKIISDSHTMIGKRGRNAISVTFPYIEGLRQSNGNAGVPELLDTNIWANYHTPSLLIFLEKTSGWNLSWQPITKPEAAIKLLTPKGGPFAMEINDHRAVKKLFNRLNDLAFQVKSGILTIGSENMKKEFSERGSLWKDLQKII